MSAVGDQLNPGLQDVPETMLWTLHSRASEAMRPDGVIRDDKAVEIYRALDYDYERSFGRAEPTLALRAMAFDQLLQQFLKLHPDAAIVNLGEGLETQRYRIDAPDALWFSVDLPQAMAVRERFIIPDAQHVHLACSATDLSWAEAIPRERPLYVTAQGLFMYFHGDDVRDVLRRTDAALRPQRMVFDVIPGWLAQLSRATGGLPRTLRYRTPPMPWGVNRYWLVPTLKRWLGPGVTVRLHDFPAYPRGPQRVASQLAARIPGSRHWGPTIVEIAR